jgi:hypothetical protein
MAKNHGARQQKRTAKQKAKRAAKRSSAFRRSTKDPTVRLQQAAKWPVVQSLVVAEIWERGIGYAAIAREESPGRLVFGVFLVDVHCLGVKDAYWRDGTLEEFNGLIRRMEKQLTMSAISPACLVKIVNGAVEYAQSFGFPPHDDFHHAAMLLDGIDTSTCTREFTYGRDGKPFYVQGPNESYAQAEAISQRIQRAGGHYLVELDGAELGELADIDDGFDQLDSDEDDEPSDEV